MSTWTKQKLGDIAQVIDCPHSTPKWEGEGIFAVRNFNLLNGKIVRNKISYVNEIEFTQRTKRARPSKGDIILSREAPIGSIGYINTDEKMCLGQRVVLVRSKKVNSKFLLYQLLSSIVQNQFKQSNGTGSTVSNLRISIIEGSKVLIPDNNTQAHIASVLSAYDDLIENNEKRIKVLEEMAQLLYIDWFVKFKFPGHEKVKMVDSDGEYDKIPAGWEDKRLSDSNIFLVCKDRIKKFKGEKLYFDTSCIDGINIIKEPLVVDWDTAPSRAQFSPVYNSVWFARMSKTYKVIVFDKSSEIAVNQYLLSSGMLGLKTQEKYLGFLFVLIKSSFFHQQKDSRATGATQVSLTDEGFAGIKFLLPSTQLVEKYSAIVNGYIGQILALQRYNQNLSKIRNLLIPQLISGRREVK